MTLEIVIACRQSPAQLVGAASPIAIIEVGAPHQMWLWYPRERTTRLHRDRDLAGIVTLTCVARWADYALAYAELIARGCDGIIAIDGEVEGNDDLAPLDERELAIAWRELEERALTALNEHERATHRERLAWESGAVWRDREATPAPTRA